MNLDQIQYLFMAICGPVALFVILRAFPFSQHQRWMVGLILAGWFALTAWTPLPKIGPVPGALFGIVLPVMVLSAWLWLSPAARKLIAGASVSLLVALHVTRVAGGLYILLHLEGRLSNPFATVAGWGDLLTATLAIPAAIMAWRARPGWEAWVMGWSIIGFLDFICAVALGATSQPGSPLQLFLEAPGTAILGEQPWRMIPNYFVPLYIVIHVALFIRLGPTLVERWSRRNEALGATGPA